mmetsp:Transcript_13944/g.29387  ORF Transcript_13944/g.29387 Transcript_13944/m.29387 type:complete len:824 (-) Transcript_13944:180-2651(-)
MRVVFLSSVVLVVLATIYSANAFVSNTYSVGYSAGQAHRSNAPPPPLFASHSDNDDDKVEEDDDIFSSCDKNDNENENDNQEDNNDNDKDKTQTQIQTTVVLDWDLQSLLSSDPSMEAMLIPLMNVYDAAATAGALKARNKNAADDDDDDDDDTNTNTSININIDTGSQDIASTSTSTNTNTPYPCHAPAIFPGKTPDPPVQSLDHDGPLPPSVAPYRMFVRDYTRDMGHDGRFTVFPTDQHRDESVSLAISTTKEENEKANTTTHGVAPSLQSDVVFSMDNPLAFIRDNLSYSTSATRPKYNRKEDQDEVVVFVPGLHTAHAPDPCASIGGAREYTTRSDGVRLRVSANSKNNGEPPRSSPDRLKYISQVLDGIPMAQIHTGTHIDQGDLDIELTSDTINALLSFGLFTDTFNKNLNLSASFLSSLVNANTNANANENENFALPKKALYRLRATDLDIIHTVLSSESTAASLSRTLGDKYLGSDSKGLKDTLIRLIDIAVRSVREEKTPSTPGISSSLSSSSSLPPPPPHLVLMTYSATSNVLMAALSEWKNRVTTPIGESRQHLSENESTKAFHRDGIGVGLDESGSGENLERKVFSEEEAELLLHKALTVVTISALSQGFVDGPAYMHVSMDDDPLTSSLGITKSNPEEGGKDAVILQALSPYLIDKNDDESESDASTTTMNKGHSCIYKNDAHNIDSCVIQYLSLVRRINGATSFREMYNLGLADADSKKLDISQSLFAIDYRSVGQLIIPPHIDAELIPAMIRASGGERWLWNPSFQLGEGGVEGFDSPLPSLEYAQAELENQLGYNIYDEIVEKCCH